jgi:hypothetical protein
MREAWQKRMPPKWVDKVCREFGFDTLANKQRYRVIWGPDREEIRYGQVCQRYDDVDPRWILEVFVPHDKFGPWDEESMGPRPSGGEYWLSQIIQVEGLYISMNDYGRDTLKLLITVVEKGKALSEWEKKRWRDQQEEKRKKIWKQKFSDVYDEVTGPFGENAVSGNPGKRRSDDVILGDLSTLSPELRARLATRAGEFKQL